MAFEVTIEVSDGPAPARTWLDSWLDRLVEAGISSGLTEWRVVWRDWGVVLELAFDSLSAWQVFRDNPVVLDGLTAVPDPVRGLQIHRGWGGTGGVRMPRRPRPFRGSGAAALPLPERLDRVVADIVKPRLLEPVVDPSTAGDGWAVPVPR